MTRRTRRPVVRVERSYDQLADRLYNRVNERLAGRLANRINERLGAPAHLELNQFSQMIRSEQIDGAS